MSHDRTRVEIPEIDSAAKELDRLSRRVDALRGQMSQSPPIPAPGSDEVSVAVAENVNASGESFDTAARVGAERLRVLAAAVQTGGRNYAIADDLEPR